MSKYLTEFVGTFFLVFTISLAVATGSPFAPLAIGAVLAGMIYMGGHVSGAHYNPAVTIAFLVRRWTKASDLIPYVIAQVAGAFAAAAAGFAVTGQAIPIAPGAEASVVDVLLVEVLFTFALMLTILNVATTKDTAGNDHYGIAIALVVVAGIFVGGGISGAAFNPAVAIGLTAMNVAKGGGTLAHLWFYLVGPTAGALLAVAVFRAMNPGEE